MSKDTKNKNSEILIRVELDENKIPHKIFWKGEGSQENECKAFLLSLFDKKTKETFKIDLWTKEMEVLEMDKFFYNTLSSLTDTYMKATSNEKLAGALKSFTMYFGDEIKKQQQGHG